jgi:hypothetical protein
MKMKNLLLTMAATLGLTAATMAQNVPSYVPTNGLVGWWPFNGNANDESGNGNNGTVNGATLTSDRFANVNMAYHFTQGNSINIANSLSIDNLSLATVNLWFKTNTTTNAQLFKKGNSLAVSSSEQLSIALNFNGSNGFTTKYNSNCIPGNGWVYCSSNQISLNDNIWHMMTAVIDNDSLKYFVDGIFVSATLAPNINMDICNGGVISLGKNWNNDPDYYNGILDDIGFWNRPLTEQEISSLYNGNICYQYITVTDTLVINTGITGFNPVTYNNTIKIFPNPTNDHITIDYGNFASLNGYQLKIENSLGQQVFQTGITQQSDYLNLTTWGGNGIYFVHIIDAQGNTIDIRKIVLQ